MTMLVRLLLIVSTCTSFAEALDAPIRRTKTTEENNNPEVTTEDTIDVRLKEQVANPTTKDEEMFATAKAWQAREALISSTKFADGNCITVGFNLHKQDLAFFQLLNSQLIYIEPTENPDLGTMLYYSWCVRYNAIE